MDLLESGQVDLIVTNYPNSRMGSREQMHVISEFHDVFTASRSHYPQLEGREVSLKEIQEYPILMLDRHSTTNEFLHQTFRKEQLELVPEIELDSNDVLLDLANIGLGLAFVPDYCLHEQEKLFQIHLTEKMPARKVVLVTAGNVPLTQAAREFLQMFT